MAGLTLDDRHLIREVVRCKLRLKFRRDCLALRLTELYDQTVHKRKVPTDDTREMDRLVDRIEDFDQQIHDISNIKLAEKFETSTGYISAVSTSSFRASPDRLMRAPAN